MPGVKVSDNVVCAFNSTPLEKYENYRLHLSRWGRSDQEGPDLTPTIYNLVDGLARFLEIDRYSSHNSTQPRFLVDLLPEVYGTGSSGQVVRALTRAKVSEDEIQDLLERVEAQGSAYMPEINALFVHEFRMMYVAEEVSRFLHQACRGLPRRRTINPKIAEKDRFYVRVLEQAFGYLGSRILYPARPAIEAKHYEIVSGRARHSDRQPELGAELLGSMMGNALYDAYLEGRVTRNGLRRLMLVHIEEPGRAKDIYNQLARKVRTLRKKQPRRQ